MFERITKLTKGENSAKLKLVHRSHLESVNVPFTKVLRQQNESTWIIESVVGKREYFVEKNQDYPCTEKNSCRLSCINCNICSHMFRCQCADYLVKGNICKHIYLLPRYMLQSGENNEGQHREESAEIKQNLTKYDCENKLEVQDESNDSKNELVALRKFVANEANEDTFAMLKKRTEKTVLELLSEVQTSTAFDTESLKYTLKQVNATRSTLVSLRKNHPPTLTISLKCNEPSNKNILKQRRFYSNNRKRKEKKLD